MTAVSVPFAGEAVAAFSCMECLASCRREITIGFGYGCVVIALGCVGGAVYGYLFQNYVVFGCAILFTIVAVGGALLAYKHVQEMTLREIDRELLATDRKMGEKVVQLEARIGDLTNEIATLHQAATQFQEQGEVFRTENQRLRETSVTMTTSVGQIVTAADALEALKVQFADLKTRYEGSLERLQEIEGKMEGVLAAAKEVEELRARSEQLHTMLKQYQVFAANVLRISPDVHGRAIAVAPLPRE